MGVPLSKHPRHASACPGRELEQKWIEPASVRTASPKFWMDAYLAAFAMIGDYRMVTTDKAFKQFNGVDPVVPG